MGLLTGQNATRFSQYTADQFTGNGTTTTFTLSRTPATPAALIVTIDGIKQHTSTYTVGINQIIFSEAPPSGANIECTAIGAQGLAYDLTDGSVTTAKLAGGAVTTVKLLDSSVTTAKIADGSLTAVKLDSFNSTGTGALPMPSGTTAQRPVNPPNGTARYNTDWGSVEYFYNGFWFDRDPRSGPANVVGAFQQLYNGQWGTAQAAIGGVSVNAWGERTSDSTWVVPAGVTRVFWKMWGAGGGGGAYGGWRQGSRGGGGGYTQAITPVVPGETITIRVGQRGYSRWGANRAYPDGGGASTGGGDNQYTGAGGGSTSIKIPSISAEFCLFAGGGGGGGSCNGYGVNSGGAGGGFAGEGAMYTPYNGGQYAGDGGTQTAGGRGGTPSNTAGGAGSFKQGGTHANPNCYGGGGGGGWYGGGSGSYNPSPSMGGGGGGSGYVYPSLIGITIGGKGFTPGNVSDPWLSRFSDSASTRYADGGEEDGIGGPGLLVWFYV